MLEQFREGSNSWLSFVSFGRVLFLFEGVFLWHWRNKNRFSIWLSLKKVTAMYFHAHDVNSTNWSSCCRPIQISPATNLSQKKRLFEDIWWWKDSKLQKPHLGGILVVSDCMHQCLCFFALLCLPFSFKEGISSSCHKEVHLHVEEMQKF